MLQVQAINKFVNNRNLPPELCEDISRHVETSQVMHQEQGDADVFSTLSHTLQVGCKLCLVPCCWQLLLVTGAWRVAAPPAGNVKPDAHGAGLPAARRAAWS